MNTKARLVNLYETVEQVELGFYKAFGLGDFVLMESLYADYGVSCTHPNSPTIVGRQNVIDYWKFILKDIPQIRIDVEALNIFKGEGVEVHQVLESFDLCPFSQGKSEVFTTNVYVLQENGWKLQMQHASLSKAKMHTPELESNDRVILDPQLSMVIN